MAETFRYFRMLEHQDKREIEPEFIEGIIEWFEDVQKRPQLYFGAIKPELVTNGMYWLHSAIFHLNFRSGPDVNIAEERGWERNALGLAKPMKDSGMTDEEIVNELLEIELESWRRLLQEAKTRQ